MEPARGRPEMKWAFSIMAYCFAWRVDPPCAFAHHGPKIAQSTLAGDTKGARTFDALACRESWYQAQPTGTRELVLAHGDQRVPTETAMRLSGSGHVNLKSSAPRFPSV